LGKTATCTRGSCVREQTAPLFDLPKSSAPRLFEAISNQTQTPKPAPMDADWQIKN
jgi:hypothetical protein